MATYTFASLQDDYAQRWSRMLIKPDRYAAIDSAARLVLTGKASYQAVQAETGVPWAMVGVLHYRESSCDFRGVLHNGEKILGTGRKTKLEPKGRGPFETWLQAAQDALAIKGYSVGAPDWTIPRFLYEGERFNGFGYRMHGVPSAYLWSGSDQYVCGKYVSDGVWDGAVVDKQVGVAPLMRRIFDLDAGAVFAGGVVAPPLVPALDPDVSDLQRLLNEVGGYGLHVDGLYGPRTRGAVKDFQSAHGLVADGIAGPVTLAKLAEVLRASTPAAA
ncbi:peptidoglycan-binding protein [Xanthobacter sediminis]